MKKLVAVLVVVFLVSAGMFFLAGKLQSNPAAVDLTKDESLRAIRLQYMAESAIRDRNAYVLELYSRYGLSEETHQVDVANGRFIPIEKKQGPETLKP